ncbi:sensor histidine kinase [Paenibacillus donghaensis]|uniref:HAMP domain-containing protein n=1 Tax=Paenibacillus donghaensis TaxID=414771 RepID=A0A2Z2KQK2_9BACL|nr:sensor histidine kinase [Paenibacillus donghaensis]ASA23662.1 hypothetical protein B9T62_24435 [Paenibacillus donghaensis]
MRANLFVKMVAILFTLITITLALYGISYRKDVQVITHQIETTDLNHLEFLTSQIDSNINQLAGSLYALQRDPTIRDYGQIQQLGHLIEPNQTILTVLEKLSLQAGSSSWENQLLLYHVQRGETLSPDSSLAFDTGLLARPLPAGWEYQPPSGSGDSTGRFRLLLSEANRITSPGQARMIAEISFPAANMEKMFEAYQAENSGDIFLYHRDHGILYTRHTDQELADHLVPLPDTQAGTAVVQLADESYLVSAVPSATLGWMVVHYSPLEQILQPIQSSKYSFTVATGVLLAMSLLVSLIMYRQIQRPISLLLRSLNRMKDGRWSTRIQVKSNNEFTQLHQEFNDMAAELQALIEQVYLEQLRTKDAHLKQLQSQINPHFLYNCLFFMKSKASIGDTESVEAMALNLGEYYRYITKMDHSMTTISEEIKLLENYLAIQNLRKQRLQYKIEIPDELMNEQIPRLLIQPLVENSIIHGIERKIGLGFIAITASRSDMELLISVEDNGAGMSPDQITGLWQQIHEPERADGGCGLWNVQQRLKHQFGEASTLLITASEQGGLQVTLHIQKKEEHDASNPAG